MHGKNLTFLLIQMVMPRTWLEYVALRSSYFIPTILFYTKSAAPYVSQQKTTR